MDTLSDIVTVIIIGNKQIPTLQFVGTLGTINNNSLCENKSAFPVLQLFVRNKARNDMLQIERSLWNASPN